MLSLLKSIAAKAKGAKYRGHVGQPLLESEEEKALVGEFSRIMARVWKSSLAIRLHGDMKTCGKILFKTTSVGTRWFPLQGEQGSPSFAFSSS